MSASATLPFIITLKTACFKQGKDALTVDTRAEDVQSLELALR